MAFILKDRIKEGTTTTGTGDITLGGAAATFETFQSYMTDGDTTYYAIVHTESGVDEWEVGLGTWNTGNTLTRTTVLAGSNGTSAVNFSSGTKNIFMTYPAAHAALAEDDVTFANITVTGTVDGRDVAADGTKLDTVETNADVTDAVNVAAAGALMKSGGTMTGNLILNADPTTALGAATKEYVDTIAAAGIHYHTPVRVEAPSALTATYDNGTSGVGATLTNSGTQAVLVIDGVTLSTSDRVLVYNQTNAAHNGIYTVTNTGSASTNWVLTRATDADSYGASDPNAMGEGDAYFVKEGDTGAGELYVMNTSGTITFGTTAINFTVIAETAVYSAGTGMSLDGTTFSIGQDVGTTANVTFNQVTAAIIGNVTGNVTGDVTGNADTATALETARTIQLSGDVTGSASFDGSANINITAAVQDDSHAHVISNVDGLQTALDGKVPTTRTITAGNGLTGGGDLSANRTLTVGAGSGITVSADAVAHADTSTQASVNNSNGTVIQDITLDTYGHITGINSVNLDGRYYTETEADNRFVNVTGDTMSGQLVVDDGNANPLEIKRSSQVGIEFNDTSVGSRYLGVNGGNLWFGSNLNHGINNRVFHDGYHPNADAWTTGRTHTVTLTGEVTGTASQTVDGSGNKTWSIATTLNHSALNDQYVNITGDTMTGILNIVNASDYQLKVDGGSSTWAGIRFEDTNNNDTIWYRGANSTFAIGGGGSNVAGKKLHVDGGMSVGSSSDAISTPTQGIYSQGGISIAGTIGTRDNTLSIVGDNNSSTIASKVSAYDTVFSVLPWDNGETYLASGVYYDDGTWVHSSSNDKNCLFAVSGNNGGRWWASSGSAVNWNVASSVNLWNSSGTWVGAVAKSPTLTLSGDASGSATFTNLGNATLSVTVANDSHSHSNYVLKAGDTMTGELNVTHNGGATGSSAPTYSQANIELQTSSNHTPAISFHRGGYSATTLYEYDGELYVNPWTTRSQAGKLLSSGNYSLYTDSLIGKARSLGWIPSYGSATESNVQWNDAEEAVALYSSSDTSIGMAYKAIYAKAGQVVRFSVPIKSSAADSDGLYVRLSYYAGNLPDGKTHTSGNAVHPFEVQNTGQMNSWSENSAMTTGWRNFEYDYTMPADGYVSLVILNWTGFSGTVYAKQPDIQKVYNYQDSGRNLNLITNSTANAGGIVQKSSAGSFQFQLYGDGTNYGFLDGDWASWDIKKVTNGKMHFNGNDSYYLQPESASLLNSLWIDNKIFFYDSVSTDDARGIYFNNGTSTDYAIFRESGAWSSPYPDLVIGFHTGVKIGGYTSYGGTRFYSDAPAKSGATELMSVGNGDSNVRVANRLIVNSASDNAIDVAGGIAIGSEVILKESTDRANLLQITSSTSGWGGLQIRNSSDEGRWSFMTDGAAAGIYDDENGDWHIYMTENAGVQLRHNSIEQLQTHSGGVAVRGLNVGSHSNGNPHNANGIQVNTSTEEKIVLSGSSNPYIRWQEGTTDRFYIQWVAGSNAPLFHNQEGGNFQFRSNSTSSSTNLQLMASDGDLYGSFYGNHDNNIGILDQDGQWAYRHLVDSLHEWRINNVVEMDLDTTGLDLKSNLLTNVEDITLLDSIVHVGDTDTYIQFHNANEWRVVTGGVERLEVTSTAITSAEPILAPSFEATSDRNLKENIVKIDSALDKVQQLSGYTYNFKDTPDKPSAGLIAQEVQEVLPEAVCVDKNENLALNYNATIALLVEAIKEQQIQIENLKEKLG